MHSQRVTQCTTSANMHSHTGEEVFRKKIILQGVNQIENFTKVKIKNDIYYRGEKHY